MTPIQQQFLAELEKLVRQYECFGVLATYPDGLAHPTPSAIVHFPYAMEAVQTLTAWESCKLAGRDVCLLPIFDHE